MGNSPRPERYDPDLWTDELAFLGRPGQHDIQKLLVVWGRYDPSFEIGEAYAYRRDVAKAEVHVIDAGHFALDEAADEVSALVNRFLVGTD